MTLKLHDYLHVINGDVADLKQYLSTGTLAEFLIGGSLIFFSLDGYLGKFLDGLSSDEIFQPGQQPSLGMWLALTVLPESSADVCSFA